MNNRSALYRELNGESKEEPDANNTPDAEECANGFGVEYGNIKKNVTEKHHTSSELNKSLQRKALKQNIWEIINEMAMKTLGKIKNWKAVSASKTSQLFNQE